MVKADMDLSISAFDILSYRGSDSIAPAIALPAGKISLGVREKDFTNAL